MDFQSLLSGGFDINLGSLSISPAWWQAGAIVALLFLLVLIFAHFQKSSTSSSLKGIWSGVAIGFFLALILEGFLIIAGRTIVTEMLGWKDAPKPITHALDLGREKLVDVLGVTSEIPSSVAYEEPSAIGVVGVLQSLPPDEVEKAKKIICE